MRCVLEKRDWVEVGQNTSLLEGENRQPHFVRLGPLFVRGSDKDTSRLFVMPQDFRMASASGVYLTERRRAERPQDARPAHEIAATAGDPNQPLRGLSYVEADILARSLHGRLPTQKEADAVFSRVPRDAALEERVVWTSSDCGKYDYSLCRFDMETGETGR